MSESNNSAQTSGIEALEEELREIEERKPKKSGVFKFFTIILAILVLLTVMRIGQLMLQDEADEEAPLTNVSVMTAQTGDIAVTAPVSGKVASDEESTVMVTMGGEVTAVNIENGQYVKKGQLLYSVDDTSLQESYRQAQLAYESAKTSFELLKTNLERTEALYNEGAVSQSELESLKTQYATAEIGLQQAQSGIVQVASNLNNVNVKAPISGYVSSVGVTKGSYAMAGSVACQITNVDKLLVTASISEYLISSVKKGDAVKIYVKSASSEPYAGKVKNVSEAPAKGTYTYTAEIAFEGADSNIKAGMFAEVYFTSSIKYGVVRIPSDAVVIKEGSSVVAVINGSGENASAEIRNVTTGIDNGEFVEITSGLSAGEVIAVKGQQYVLNGENVNIVG